MRTTETTHGDDLVEVTIVGVNQEDPPRTFIERKEKDGDRRLPVFIGPA